MWGMEMEAWEEGEGREEMYRLKVPAWGMGAGGEGFARVKLKRTDGMGLFFADFCFIRRYDGV